MKVGDKVKIVNVTEGDYNKIGLNKSGNIIQLDKNTPELDHLVRLDSGFTYWFRKENLELI